jgi:D-alanyl-D-alanine carboxypeptidase
VKRAALAGLALCVLIAGTVTRAGAATPDVQAALAKLVRAGAPGAVVLVRNGDDTTVLAGGVAVLASRQPMTTGDHFRVGSITKSFVATVVLQLVAEGRLVLDRPLATQVRGILPAGSPITVRELLQHTSGLWDYTGEPGFFAPYLKGNLGYRWSPRRLLAIALSHEPLFAPGTDWSYSNTNYLVLGLAVQAVTKHALGDELRTRIFAPLHLGDTRFAADRLIPAPAAHGYYKGIDITTADESWAWAAGANASTAADIATFYRALLSGKLLHPAQLRAMEHTVVAGGNDYGLGLFRTPTPCGDAWGHNGLIPGYRSFALSSKDGRRQAVVLATTRTFPGSSTLSAAFDNLAAVAFCS